MSCASSPIAVYIHSGLSRSASSFTFVVLESRALVDIFEDMKPVVVGSQELRLGFRDNYIKRLLPALKGIQEQGANIGSHERLQAIKYAVDMSLALTATGVIWSQSLFNELSLMQATSNVNVAMGSSNQSFNCDLSIARFTNHAHKSRFVSQFSRPARYFSNYLTKSRFVAERRLHRSPMSKCSLLLKRFRGRSHAKLTKSKHLMYLKVLRSSIPRALKRRGRSTSKQKDVISEGQITSLRHVIPGGGRMDDPVLLKETADYIVSLQIQVEALESLAQATAFC